jgi:hypothetical protein
MMALINGSATMTKTRAYPIENRDGLSDSQACPEYGSVVVVADGAVQLVTEVQTGWPTISLTSIDWIV